MQLQLYCTDLTYCDFVVYTTKSIHIERIEINIPFITFNIRKAELFFRIALLPELIGRWFSRPSIQCTPQAITSIPPTDSQNSEKFCYCQQVEHVDMVGCDNSKCQYQWFHLPCLGLTDFPHTSKWYCPDCRKSQHYNNN